MWIDLIIEYEELFRKNRYMMPKHPTFIYCYNKKHIPIMSDSVLMSMLERLGSKKVIIVYVGSGSEPSDCVVAARNLTESLKKNTHIHFGVEPPKSNNKEIDDMTSQNDEEWTEINDILLDMHDVILDNLARVDDEEEQGRSQLRKNKGKGGASVSKPRAKRLTVTRKLPPNEPVTLTATTTFSNAPVVDTPNLYTTSSHNNSLLLHKIPKSTAARRGLLNTSHQIEAQVITEKEFNVGVHHMLGRIFEHGESSMQVSAGNEGPGGVRNEIHDVLEREHGSDEVHDVLEREHGSDEGDGWFGEINDNYDPYLSDKWESE
ncbi:uncharacterized protein LOC110720440 [Chenopodium quinoa]|uniref:uncharacterized protein LOC110720440 n=1 Tax=Chenopodium quinoa TaxID=63459 RepID=UPI000B7738D6|nr:uncharacterized protein LOC110720440 [Chenopodium quinoa]